MYNDKYSVQSVTLGNDEEEIAFCFLSITLKQRGALLQYFNKDDDDADRQATRKGNTHSIVPACNK